MNEIYTTGTVYNYTTRESKNYAFPMSDEELEAVLKSGEVMVDDAEHISIVGEYGMNLTEFNNAIRALMEEGVSVEDLDILSKTYLFSEIVEGRENISIIDFDNETNGWSTSDFHSESDKGRVLYDLGLASFPAEVPEELEPYMDYAILYRDAEVNLGLRCVTANNGQYIVSIKI